MSKKIHLMTLYAILLIVSILAYPHNLSLTRGQKRTRPITICRSRA